MNPNGFLRVALLPCFLVAMSTSAQSVRPRTEASAAEPALVIPVAGSVAGAFATYFRTDVTIVNERDVAQTVYLGLLEYGAGFSYGPSIETGVVLQPHSTTTWENAVETLFGLQKLGAILINPRDVSGFDPDARLRASYRIWTSRGPGAGSYSQSSAAVAIPSFPSGSDAKVVFGVRLGEGFRCNVGVVNMAYYGRSFRIRAASPAGAVERTVYVEGYTMMQVALPDAELGYVAIQVIPIDAAEWDQWTAYASSIDNRSGDSWLQNATPLEGPETGDDNRLLPIAGSVPGAFGTSFSSDVTIFNHRAVQQSVKVTFVPATPLNAPASPLLVTIPPHESRTVTDIGAELEARGLGSVFIESVDANFISPDPAGRLDASVRIWTPDPVSGGTMSQSSNAVGVLSSEEDEWSRKDAIGLRLDAGFRTNVGVSNVLNEDARWFTIVASSPRGSVRTMILVEPRSLKQIALPGADLGYVRVTVWPEGDRRGRWAAWASSVDNVSGDSWLVNLHPSDEPVVDVLGTYESASMWRVNVNDVPGSSLHYECGGRLTVRQQVGTWWRGELAVERSADVRCVAMNVSTVGRVLPDGAIIDLLPATYDGDWLLDFPVLSPHAAGCWAQTEEPRIEGKFSGDAMRIRRIASLPCMGYTRELDVELSGLKANESSQANVDWRR